jgi:uncharacterized protein YcbX
LVSHVVATADAAPRYIPVVTDYLGTVAALYRFPVKSMLGEQLTSVELTDRGFAGDRGWAVVDRSDGKIATGKHPRKWGRLVELAASYVDGPGSPAAITFPDGSTVRSDGAIDDALTSFLGRDVALVSQRTEGQALEEVWPQIEGLAPPEVVEALSRGRREGDDPVSDIPVSSMAPEGTFFDLTTLSVMTMATLRRLGELEPGADFDVRRYRPNVLVDVPGEGFVENEWVGATLGLGETARARVDMPTMRCVMTTLARDGMANDPGSLRAIARHNRLEIFGGKWACAGIYATITAGGTLAVADPVTRGAD